MKMPLLLSAALCALVSSATLAQTLSLTPAVANINALSARNGVDVFLTQGNTESLRIDAKGFDEDEIVVDMNNGILKIGVDRKGIWHGMGRNSYVKAYLTVKNLSAINVSSGADVHGQTDFTADQLAINVSSGADLTMHVKARDMTVSVSSGADATLSGSTERLVAKSSGGADLHAQKLIADVCQVQASGGADAKVYARKELRMQASGGGDIDYSGPGQVVSRQTSGGGDINGRND
ncbi:DUF2807 domain-containing protein [Fibrella sp. HMF5335]|uniref:DUF2807 domain-containing protein n=1 Tax=Fibrella rubiginis TaxID=2817060 RepID=A0A939K1D0_9BACT|nr:head GIN domain-containing protein [Fibrella rubiginis]MBO0937027.1 DUF2807 domain-containing protein [Fibrella rubiginis]